MRVPECEATCLILTCHARVLMQQENAVAGPIQSPVLKMKVVPPEALSIPIGSNRVLECEAGGNPVPTIHWLKNGKRVSQVRCASLSFNVTRLTTMCVPRPSTECGGGAASGLGGEPAGYPGTGIHPVPIVHRLLPATG